MKKIIFVLMLAIALILLAPSAVAESPQGDADRLYSQLYESSKAEDAFRLLPEETLDILEDFNIDPKSPESFGELSGENLFSLIWQFIKTGALNPLKVTTLLLGLVIIFAALEGMGDKSLNGAFGVVICLGSALILLQPVLNLISGVTSGIGMVTTFMLGFVPVYAGILTTSGFISSAGGFSSLLLMATEVVGQFISAFLLPSVSGCLCLGISGAISPGTGATRLAELFKKIYLWISGIITTLFLGVLSVQTTVTAAADNVGLRASKAVLSGAIPIMGPAISETLGTARGCLTLLRSGVGIYGALAVIITLLPVVTELLLWRMGILLCSGVSEIFGLSGASALFKAVDFSLSVLIGAAVFVSMLFIISLTVIAPK